MARDLDDYGGGWVDEPGRHRRAPGSVDASRTIMNVRVTRDPAGRGEPHPAGVGRRAVHHSAPGTPTAELRAIQRETWRRSPGCWSAA